MYFSMMRYFINWDVLLKGLENAVDPIFELYDSKSKELSMKKIIEFLMFE